MSDDTHVIDLDEYGLNTEDVSNISDDTIKTLGKKFINALKTFGYCYVKNHGIDEQLIKEYLAVSRDFFNEPADVKVKYPIDKHFSFGWVKMEGEMCDPKSHAGDLHEAFLYSERSGYEAWPPIRKFETTTKNMYNVGKRLAVRFCDILSLGLDQPKDFMRNAHKLTAPNCSSFAVKTLLYPPIRSDSAVIPNQCRIGEHTDIGTLSFIFQDNVGGLEVRDLNGKLIPADPIPGTIFVVIGALLQRWTADDLIATSHRIPIPTDKNRKESARQSIVWFLVPDDECVVTCLDGSNKYEPIRSRSYFNYRAEEMAPIADDSTDNSPIEK